MQKKNKTAYLRFMCLPEEKEKFEKACNEGGYSMSKVLRKMMNE